MNEEGDCKIVKRIALLGDCDEEDSNEYECEIANVP
jgi:hypothetical protein